MTHTTRRKHGRTAWVSAALFGALLLTGCGASKEAPPPTGPATNFALTDHNGQPFELTSLRGKTVMLFFGYSTCPDVCPTTLSKLVRVSRLLGADSARVKTLYVTVDPERDTPEVLKADLGLFRLDALGLTGSRAEVDKVVAQYGVKYEIVPTPQSAGKYTVSHSTTLYVLDANGALQRSFPYEATADEIVAGVKDVITGGGTS